MLFLIASLQTKWSRVDLGSPAAVKKNQYSTHRTQPQMSAKSYILPPGPSKWVAASYFFSFFFFFLLLSSPTAIRNEVVLSAVEECYFGQQVLQGLYWPWFSVDHSGVGHHQRAPKFFKTSKDSQRETFNCCDCRCLCFNSNPKNRSVVTNWGLLKLELKVPHDWAIFTQRGTGKP